MSSPFDLPDSRPASMTESGKRVYLYPADYSGFWRSIRSWVYWVLIAIFLALPWIRIGGNPALLLDLTHRRFSVLGLTFWAHEAPILVLVFLSFVFLIGATTAMLGRVWCGWACPQTVFVDRIFRVIERWIEGSAIQRRKLDDGPINAKYLLKKGLKWVLFLGAALVITHSFLMYFVGPDRLWAMLQSDPREHWSAFLFMAISTLIILFDFGWFREQFCIVACPYGRFQSVMMDKDSLVVGYDAKRGEPRKQNREAAASGDCVNCYRCVQVCPTGVDIRRGTQMECIMCTACIDACDTVMTKVNRPKGLIRYTSESILGGQRPKWTRPRVFVYVLVLACLLATLAWVVNHREMVPVYIQRPHTPYSLLQNGNIVNERLVTVRNQYFEPIVVQLKVPAQWHKVGIRLITPVSEISAPPGTSVSIPIFIEFPPGIAPNGGLKIALEKQVHHNGNSQITRLGVQLVAPLR